MKRQIKAIVLSIVLMLLVGFSYAYCHTNVSKWRGCRNYSKNIKKDSIDVKTNEYPNTITIAFGDDNSDVDIEVYKQGCLIVQDKETLKKGVTINYTIDDTTPTAYQVYIKKDGKLVLVVTVSLEE